MRAAAAWAPALPAAARDAVPARRAALVAGCIAGAALAWAAAPLAPTGAVDADLARLLRGMALVKGLLAVGAAALVWWRLGHAATARVAAGYVVCVALLAASAVLVWQLAFVGAAALVFHAGELAGLVLAWRDGRGWRRA